MLAKSIPAAAVVANRRRQSAEPILRSSAPRGVALENDLDAFHRTLIGWYVMRNLADRAKGKKGEPDFTAIPATPITPSEWTHASGTTYYRLDAIPRVVMFDAKSTKAEKWPISLLAQHQAVAFARLSALGHTAGVYLRLGSGPDAGDWWLPWADLAEGWNDWWTRKQTFYPTPTRRIVAMDWTRAVGT